MLSREAEAVDVKQRQCDGLHGHCAAHLVDDGALAAVVQPNDQHLHLKMKSNDTILRVQQIAQKQAHTSFFSRPNAARNLHAGGGEGGGGA